MIKHSFSILNGLGPKLERRLWDSGILTWDDFIQGGPVRFLSDGRKRYYTERLKAHAERLGAGDAPYFSDALKSGDHWRLFSAFGGEAVYLDIETNGLPAYAGGHPTLVGLYDGSDFKCFVWGRDLTAENLMRELSHYKYLVTFYGAVFDIPFLKSTLEGFSMDLPHFDLCFGAKKLGMKGGLKKIEVQLGIERPQETKGLDGYAAVLLWREAMAGRHSAMERLIAYNREDTVNLLEIANTVYGRLRESTGILRYLRTATGARSAGGRDE